MPLLPVAVIRVQDLGVRDFPLKRTAFHSTITYSATMSGPRGKCPDWFYEAMDAAKLQRLQSEHMAIWDEFKLHPEARGLWRAALRIMVTEHRSFAEAAVFVGYRLPED